MDRAPRVRHALGEGLRRPPTEGGTPPRSVKIDELVALSAVFGLPLDALLTDPDASLTTPTLTRVRALWAMEGRRQKALELQQQAERRIREAIESLEKIASELVAEATTDDLIAVREHHLLPPDLPPTVQDQFEVQSAPAWSGS